MLDDYLWKSYVYRTTFNNVKYQDLVILNRSSEYSLRNQIEALIHIKNRFYEEGNCEISIFRFEKSTLLTSNDYIAGNGSF